MMSLVGFYWKATRNAGKTAWGVGGILASVAGLAVPGLAVLYPKLGQSKVWIGVWLPFPDLVWVLPVAGIAVFSVLGVIPAIYNVYRQQVSGLLDERQKLGQRVTDLLGSMDRPYILLAVVKDSNNFEIHATNAGKGLARELHMPDVEPDGYRLSFDCPDLLDPSSSARIRMMWGKGEAFSVLYGGDIAAFARQIANLHEEDHRTDREIHVADISILYKDIRGFEYTSRWAVIFDQFNAVIDPDRTISLREYGVARGLPAVGLPR